MIGRFALILALASLLCATSTQAQEILYVTDSMRITVRSGPSMGNKVTAMIKTGDKVTMLGEETSGWVLLRLENGKEGWALKRFLTKKRPAVLRLAELDPQNQDLSRRLEELHTENQRLGDSLAKTEAEASDLQTLYSKLKDESAGFITLQSRFEKLQKKFNEQANQLKELSVEKQSLEFSSDLRWFLAGAAVLVVGWFMGLALHRRKKRWNSSLY